MHSKAQRIPYQQTNCFTKLVVDYINNAEPLNSFYTHKVSLTGIQNAINLKSKEKINRNILADTLQADYAELETSKLLKNNLELLKNDNTFTVTTAHQPNIFTGPLYFIYKIVHAIKLASYLNLSFPNQHFVPVYFMGSEDADLEELGHTFVNYEKIVWNTNQQGAVGRMLVDKDFIDLIHRINGELSVEIFGKEIINLIKDCYTEGATIQSATFKLVNALFGEYGLVILLPDNKLLKESFSEIIKDDLLNQTATEIVLKTSKELSKNYKVQVTPREINLFYLKDNVRSRLIIENEIFKVIDTDITFTKEAILTELKNHPDRFSPNVILRGLFQETILPNVAFVGGAGELAYWLQLKELFAHYKTALPVLVLRNSFLIVEKKWADKIQKLGFKIEDFFLSEFDLQNNYVVQNSTNQLSITSEEKIIEEQYELLKTKVQTIDTTLQTHIEALLHQALKKLSILEKKILKSEKRKFEDEQIQIQKIKQHLFPNGSLQERKENISPFYAKYGKTFIEVILKESLTLEQEFVILEID